MSNQPPDDDPSELHPSGTPSRVTAAEHIEADRERAGQSGDELARAVDRHRDELGMPAEPADGEDVTDPANADDPE